MKKLIYLFFGLIFLVSCGGSSSDGGNSSVTDISGTWSGPYDSSNNSGPALWKMVVTLQQNKNSFTGTFSTSTGAHGTVSGNISGDSITFTLKATTRGCEGSFDGTGSVVIVSNGIDIIFKFKGSSTCGGEESGDGILIKQ